MSAVQSWVIDRLRDDDQDDIPSVKITVRIDPGDYVQLTEIAKRLDMSKTATAGALLENAISDAMALFNHQDDDLVEAYITEEQDRQEREAADAAYALSLAEGS